MDLDALLIERSDLQVIQRKIRKIALENPAYYTGVWYQAQVIEVSALLAQMIGEIDDEIESKKGETNATESD